MRVEEVINKAKEYLNSLLNKELYEIVENPVSTTELNLRLQEIKNRLMFIKLGLLNHFLKRKQQLEQRKAEETLQYRQENPKSPEWEVKAYIKVTVLDPIYSELDFLISMYDYFLDFVNSLLIISGNE